MELLAPAGSFDALRAAVENGADAVYLGGTLFSARASAANFDEDEMKAALDYCHIRGVRAYVTVNTLLNDEELGQAVRFLQKLYLWGADAVIIQDLGLASRIQQELPELEIHASTQMTPHNPFDLVTLEKIGFARVVLARELSIEQITEIAGKTRLEIEVFVHGALCISYSGQCLMSSFIGGRSGNRGRCAQPCRKPYTVDGQTYPGPYVLSPRDLCLIEHLPALADAGVTSLKIEGRLKRPEYVGAVVRTYRDALDGKPYNKSDLGAVFNRGFTTAYALGRQDPELITYHPPRKQYTDSSAEIVNKIQETYNSERAFRKVNGYLYARLGQNSPLELTIVDEDGISATVNGELPAEPARKQSLEAGDLRDKLLMMGNDPLNINELSIELDEGLYLPVSDIKQTRRKLVRAWSAARLESYKSRTLSNCPSQLRQIAHMDAKRRSEKEVQVAVTVGDLKSATAAIEAGADLVYFSGAVFKRTPKNWLFELSDVHQIGAEAGVPVYAHIDRITDMTNLDVLCRFLPDHEYDGVLLGNFGTWEYLRKTIGDRPVHTDWSFNVFNQSSAEYLSSLGATCITASLELRLDQIELIASGSVDLSVIVHGPLESMISQHCLLHDQGCNGQECQGLEPIIMKDTKGFAFPVLFDRWCRTHIYNSHELSLLDKIDQVSRIGVKYIRIEGRTKSPEWVNQTVRAYKMALRGENATEMIPKSEYTKGHYFRGVK